VWLWRAVQVVGVGFALCAVSSSERGDVPAMSSKLDKRQKEKVRVLICMVHVCVDICVQASERVVGWCELQGNAEALTHSHTNICVVTSTVWVRIQLGSPPPCEDKSV
jgi:hypothetical protein